MGIKFAMMNNQEFLQKICTPTCLAQVKLLIQNGFEPVIAYFDMSFRKAGKSYKFSFKDTVTAIMKGQASAQNMTLTRQSFAKFVAETLVKEGLVDGPVYSDAPVPPNYAKAVTQPAQGVDHFGAAPAAKAQAKADKLVTAVHLAGKDDTDHFGASAPVIPQMPAAAKGPIPMPALVAADAKKGVETLAKALSEDFTKVELLMSELAKVNAEHEFLIQSKAVNLNKVVPLHAATHLRQAVMGTSAGSTYRVAAIAPLLKLAFRFVPGQLSIRIEGMATPQEAAKLDAAQFEMKKSSKGVIYWSKHLECDVNQKNRVFGSCLYGLGIEFKRVLPAGELA